MQPEPFFEPCEVAEERIAECRVFGGSAHPDLTAEICENMGIPISPSLTQRFSNDNIFTQLRASVREKEVFIVQPLCPPANDNLVELLLMCDAARSASAKRVTAVIPYYSYARSDKKDGPRISIAARLIADILVTAGVDHVITMTLHSPQVHGFFSVPTDHLADRYVFARYLSDSDLSRSVIVAPDMGHAKQASKLGRLLDLPIAAVSKQRIDDTTVEAETMIGHVKGRDAIIYDDEVATAGTVIETVRLLEQGGARSIRLVCAHGLFTGPAIERLKALENLTEIITTNTVPIPPEKRLPHMTVLSVGPVFAEAIRRILEGASIQPLFSY